MKWLAATFLCLLTNIAVAEQQDTQQTNVVTLPIFITCSPNEPNAVLEKQFGEIGFVEGNGQLLIPGNRQVEGVFRLFLNPADNNSFTVMFEVGDSLMHCMVMSGEGLGPMMRGEKL